jgi:hypothetical protein
MGSTLTHAETAIWKIQNAASNSTPVVRTAILRRVSERPWSDLTSRAPFLGIHEHDPGPTPAPTRRSRAPLGDEERFVGLKISPI